jgi:ABC-2 type transport system permease protein
MTRSLRLIELYARRTFLEWMSWRGFLVTLVLGQCVMPVLGFAVWSAALPDASNLSTYYIALLMIQLMTVFQLDHTLANPIYRGTLSHQLVQPHPPILSTLGTCCAERLWFLIIGGPVVGLLAVLSNVTVTTAGLLLALPALAIAILVRFLFTLVLALTAFWTQQAHGIVAFGATVTFLMGGSAVPIIYFPEPWRTIAAALPFSAMLGLPAAIASGSLSHGQVAMGYACQALWLALFMVLAICVWRSGIRRFTAVGG